MTVPRTRSRGPVSDERLNLSRWINAFLGAKPLTSGVKILDWHEWAVGRLEAGWTPDAVKQRIRQAWDEWVRGGNVDADPMPEELRKTLAEVFELARAGAVPAQCAVVYRSLAKQYPERVWLADWARKWEALGERWDGAEEALDPASSTVG